MIYPESVVDEVRSRNDIVDVISSYVSLKKKGSTYFGLCPFHNEKTGSFSVTPSKQMFYCFGCHEGGNVITFIQKYENYTFLEAVKFLADRAGVLLPDKQSDEDKRRQDKRSKLLEINKEAGKYYYAMLRSEYGKRGLDYLRSRKLSDETMKRFGLGFAKSGTSETYRYLRSKGYSDELLKDSGLFVYREQRGMTDKFWNRVIFPIMDVSNRIIGFGGRVMGDGDPKYLNSPETMIFDKSRNLYGLNIARSSKAKNLIICEGYMDVISMHQAGFDQAVASLGTAFTSGHANLLARYARLNTKNTDTFRYKDVLLCYDSDAAGVDAAIKAIDTLRTTGLSAKVIDMRPYKDPDEFIKNLGAEEFEKRIEKAENGFMFQIRMLEREYDINDPSGKSSFLNEVAARIMRFEDSIERDSYIDKIAANYMVSRDSLNELVKKQAARLAGVRTSEAVKTSHNKKPEEDPSARYQGMLLNWISEKPEIFDRVSSFISEDDFTDELYKKVAVVLFEQIRNKKIDPAGIVSLFSDEEEQRRVAQLFHEKIDYVETNAAKQEALRNILVKIKENSFNKSYMTRSSEGEVKDPIAVMLEKREVIDSIKRMKMDF